MKRILLSAITVVLTGATLAPLANASTLQQQRYQVLDRGSKTSEVHNQRLQGLDSRAKNDVHSQHLQGLDSRAKNDVHNQHLQGLDSRAKNDVHSRHLTHLDNQSKLSEKFERSRQNVLDGNNS
jgi:hypothetical protein